MSNLPLFTSVGLNLYAVSDAVMIAIIAAAILIVMIIIAVVVWAKVKASRRKREKYHELTERDEQALGKLTLEFANAVFKASNYDATKAHGAGNNGSAFGGNGTALAPITLVLNAPAGGLPSGYYPQQGGTVLQPIGQTVGNLPYSAPAESGAFSGTFTNAYNNPALMSAENQTPSTAVTPYQPKKSITEYDFARKLSRKAFYNAMLTYLTDDMIIERVYEEIYRPRKYTRRRLFRSKSLVRDQIKRNKRRIYKLYKGGLSVADACKSKYDLEREAELSKTCTMEYLCGFTLETVENAEKIETLKERRMLLLQLQRTTSNEIRENVERAAAIRATERGNIKSLEEKKKLAQISGRSGRKLIYNEIEDLRNQIYENDKVADEAERVIYYKNELLNNVNKSLKILETVILYRENMPSNMFIADSDAQNSNEQQNEYDALINDITELERERAIVESHLRTVIEKIGAEGSSGDRLSARLDELSERLSMLDSRLESLRSKSINKIIMAGSVYTPSVYSPNLLSVPDMTKSKKFNETVMLRRQLRFAVSETEAYEILNRLYAVRSGLTDEDKLDRELVTLVNKSIKEGLQAVELNKYMRIVKDCRAALDRTKRDMGV